MSAACSTSAASPPSTRRTPRSGSDAVGKTLALSLDRLDPSRAAAPGRARRVPRGRAGAAPAPSSCCGARPRASTRSTPTSCCSASTASRSCSSSTSTAASCSCTTSSAPGCATGWAATSPQVERSLVNAYRSACDGEWHRLDDAYALTWLPMHLRSVDEAAWRRLLLDPRWMARKLRRWSGCRRAHRRLRRDATATSASSAMPCGSRRMCSAATPRSSRHSSVGRLGGSAAPGHNALIGAARRPTRSGPALLATTAEPDRPRRAPPPHIRRAQGSVVTAVALLPRRPPRPLRLPVDEMSS